MRLALLKMFGCLGMGSTIILFIGGAVLALGALSESGDEEAFDAASILMLALVLPTLCLASACKRLILGGTRRKCKSLSKKFVKVYEMGLARTATRFDELPVMPVWTPYDSNSETTVMASTIASNDVDAFLNAFIVGFNETIDDVALLRGDNYETTGRTRVVLAVKAVQRKGELAIAALTVKPVGRIANVSIRWSCWPKSIWPGQSASTWDMALCSEVVKGNFEETIAARYFEAKGYRREAADYGRQEFTALFDKRTEKEAQDLAFAANIVLSQMTRTGASGG